MTATPKAKIPVGFVIDGKYRVTGELGRGGMAAVYEAENVDIGKRVAIKVLAQELIGSTTVVERFLREARAVAAIRSPYICDVYDSGRLEDGRPFLVLELLEGESLYERMVRVGQIDVETTVSVMAQSCRGLVRAHAAGIVHRDLKPENLFLTKDEEGRLLSKVLDFGLAKFYAPVDSEDGEQARLTREGAVFGTPAYMSPEQVRGQGGVDSRADLWALGCITYECLTGRTVWATEQGVAMTFAQIANGTLPNPEEFRADLPPNFKPWFTRALHKDIDVRFQTPKEFAEELALAMDMAPTSVRGSESSVDAILFNPRAPGTRNAEPSQASLPKAMQGDDGIRGSRAAFAGGSGAGAAEVPAAKPKPASRALLVLGASALLGGGGYFAFRTYLSPPTNTVTSALLDAGSATSASAEPSPSTSTKSLPLDTGLPFRPLISEAQALIAKGDLDGARAKIKDAVDLGNHYVPQTFLQHLDTIKAGNNKQEPFCKVTGIARPRSYDLFEDKVKVVAAGRPSIAVGPQGALIVWTELDGGTEQARAVALDDAMRARTLPFAVTPEGQSIQKPEIISYGDRFVLTYWDTRGVEAGVYARYLDSDGRIASSATLVAAAIGGANSPTVAELPDKSLLFTWVAPSDKNTDDLFLKRYTQLSDQVEPVRLTGLRPNPVGKTRIRFPVAAVGPEALHLAFRLERDPERQIQHLRIPLAELTPPGVSLEGQTSSSKDRTLGEMVTTNPARTRADWPGIACAGESCFLVWNEEGKDGIYAAYVEKGAATPVWKSQVVKNAGRHPAVAVAPNGTAQVVWFERGKVMTSRLDRDGVREASTIARVSSTEQPQPSLSPGTKAGEWFTSWLDYEGGHLEAYAVRFECK